MTPQEATKRLFAAAKSGDTEAAKAALDAGADDNAKDNQFRIPLMWAQVNGHTATARFLVDRSAALSAQRKRRDNNAAETGMLVACVLWAATFWGVVPYVANKRTTASPVPNKEPIPADLEAAQQQLRKALKDPAMTDRIIEHLNDPAAIEAFTSDPEIMANIRKLAESVKSELNDSPEKSNWTDKAVRDKASQGLERE